MKPLWELVEEAVAAAQDDQAWLNEEEAVELRKLAEWLRERRAHLVEEL